MLIGKFFHLILLVNWNNVRSFSISRCVTSFKELLVIFHKGSSSSSLHSYNVQPFISSGCIVFLVSSSSCHFLISFLFTCMLSIPFGCCSSLAVTRTVSLLNADKTFIHYFSNFLSSLFDFTISISIGEFGFFLSSLNYLSFKISFISSHFNMLISRCSVFFSVNSIPLSPHLPKSFFTFACAHLALNHSLFSFIALYLATNLSTPSPLTGISSHLHLLPVHLLAFKLSH